MPPARLGPLGPPPEGAYYIFADYLGKDATEAFFSFHELTQLNNCPKLLKGELAGWKDSKTGGAKLELLGSRCITLLGVFMVAVGMKAAF